MAQSATVYLLQNRLSDVIRLIVVLACDKHSFRTEEGLTDLLRDTPQSAASKKWFDVAKEHPEFFRFNKDGKLICLLIRFIQNVEIAKDELRDPLNVDQTQKLVDQAIALHDKQLSRYQRDNFKFPLYGAIAAAIVSLIVGLLNVYVIMISSNKVDAKFAIISDKLDSIKLIQKHRIDELIHIKNKPDDITIIHK